MLDRTREQGIFESMEARGAHRLLVLCDPPSGLRAIIALDDMTLGPALGGIRTMPYASLDEAIADAQRLSSAMTLKCAIANLPAGGGKTVVIAGPELDRPAAFRRLGAYIEDLAGRYRAAGDLGTTAQDLAHASENTRYINTTGAALGEATGAGVVACMRALAESKGHDGLAGLRVAVQGCGLIGAGVARRVAAEGAQLILADANPDTARALADELGADTVAADQICTADADILSPCAVGGVLTPELAGDLKVWGICGGANNQLASEEAGVALAERGVHFVPDFLSSAGAVIVGACTEFMDGADPTTFIDGLGDTAADILRSAKVEGATPVAVATRMARQRIADAALRRPRT